MRKKNSSKSISLFLSVLFLFSGCILYNGAFSYSLVRFVNQALSGSFSESYWAVGIGYVSTLLVYTGIVCFILYLYLSEKISKEQSTWLSVACFVIHYFFYLAGNAVNYPIYDDQGAVLEFLNRYSSANAFTEKVKLVFEPFWESRMAIERVFILIAWKITGEINFRHMFILNGTLLAGLYLVILSRFRKKDQQYHLIIPAMSLLLFQFQAFNTTFNFIGGLAYYGVLIFAVLAFSFLHKAGPRKKSLALLFGIAASLTFGSGILLFPLAVIYLWYHKRFRESIVWLLTFLLLLLINYVDRSSFASNTAPSFHLLSYLLFIAGFLGSSFQFFYTMHLPVIAGIFVLAVFFTGLFKKWFIGSPVIFLVLAFLVLSAIAAAPFRSEVVKGGEYALQVRYGIFSSVAVACACLLLIENTKRLQVEKAAAWFLLVCLAYNMLTGLFFYPQVPIRKFNLQKIIRETKHGNYSATYSIYRPAELEKLMQSSVEKGIYNPAH